MTQIDDGGPAFPHLRDTCQRVNESEHHEGLSMRDWFAGQALAGMSFGSSVPENAEWAYKVADAMLAARKANP